MVKKTTSIALGDHFAQYAQARVAAGEFGSTSEVIRDALRLHEERATFKSRLVEALDQGMASPVDEGFDIDTWYDAEFGPKCGD